MCQEIDGFTCTCFGPYTPSRRERLARWRERLRTRIWRRLHPAAARAQDEQEAAMWRRLTPALKASIGSMLAPHTDIAAAYSRSVLGVDWASSGDWTAWFEVPPAPPQPWYRRWRRRAVDGLWRVIEAL